MNEKLLHLFYYELINQIKINNLIKYLFLFFAFCTLSITLVNNHENINAFGVVFSVICIPLAMINLSNIIFKQDFNDGTIEVLSTIFSPFQITLVKFSTLLFCSLAAFLATTPILYLLYDIKLAMILLISVLGTILCASSSALICLISSVQCYFRSNTNFISVLIMPLIIPNIILIGITMQSDQPDAYIGFLYGINLILIPLCVYLSSYLIENIYNI